MRFDELVDVPIVHPLRCHRELTGAHRHSQERQHVPMAKSPPHYNLLTEHLRHDQLAIADLGWSDWSLTCVILSRLLVMYTTKTLTATLRPWCSPFHTSAYPPRYSGVSDRLWQSGICTDLGSRAWRPHILHKVLRHFFRSDSGRASNVYLAQHEIWG